MRWVKRIVPNMEHKKFVKKYLSFFNRILHQFSLSFTR